VSTVISKQALLARVDEWIAQGIEVAGPSILKPDYVMYVPIVAASRLALGGFIRPRNSIKEFVFPKHEAICTYSYDPGLHMTPCQPDATERIIVGARPCDAAALPILDPVFNWDYKDEFYNTRREHTTVVSLACTEHDDRCFCTSVGLAPDATRGSDAILLPIDAERFELRGVTPKGEALFAGFGEASDLQGVRHAGPEPAFDHDAVRHYLDEHFESEELQAAVMRCLGCGACAFTCPTCHCFDIVDEGNAAGGCRVKNWDACQFGMFTHHASGHNPRSRQEQRQRQRVQHKFRIYPEKFGEILCTGCGNCTRNCPVGLGILNTLRAVAAAVAKTE
jgi:ferredoxin